MATIDERVVEMRFDNKDFEKNVSTSLKTIDELKKSLDFEDATNSLEELQDTARHFTLDDIGNALEELASKFSWENIFKIDLLRRALDTVQNEIQRAFATITKTLMLDQVDWVNNMSLGWGKFGEKTQSVATIMAATGESLEVVNEQMEKLMFYTDETSFNFTDMAGNIGKFTANGIGLEDAVSAMEGIGNWAARSGQEAAAASRVMYNLSQAIGMGALKLMDWKSVELANMGTKEFKEVAIAAGVAKGTLIQVGDQIVTAGKKTVVTTNNFRETLAEGWLNSEVLIDTLNEYGKASELISQINAETGMWTANIKSIVALFQSGTPTMSQFEDALEKEHVNLEAIADDLPLLYEQFQLLSSSEYDFALQAYYAGQEARTFEQAMKSVSDAVSSGWMTTFELIFGQYEQAKELWSDLSENLFTIFREPIDDRNDVLEEANRSGWDDLKDSILAAGVSLEEFDEALMKASGLRDRHIATILQTGDFENFTEAVIEGAVGIDNGIDIIKAALDSLTFYRVRTASETEEIVQDIGLTYDEINKLGSQIAHWEWDQGDGERMNRQQVTERLLAMGYTEEQAAAILAIQDKRYQLQRYLTEEEMAEYMTLGSVAEVAEKTAEELEAMSEEERAAYDEMIKAQADRALIKGAQRSFREGLLNTGAIAVEVFQQLRGTLRELIPPTTAEQINNFANRFNEATESIRNYIENSETIKNIAAVIIGPVGFLLQIGQGIVKVLIQVGKVVGILLSPIVALVSLLGSIIRNVNKLTGGFNPIAWILETLANAISVVVEHLQKIYDYVYPIVRDKILAKIEGPLSKITEKIEEFKSTKVQAFEDFLASIQNVDIAEKGDKIVAFLTKVWDFLRKIRHGQFEEAFAVFSGEDSENKETFFDKLKKKWQEVKPYLGPVGDFIDNIAHKIASFKKQVSDLVAGGEVSLLGAVFQVLKTKLVSVLSSLGIELPTFEDGVSKIATIFDWLGGIFQQAKEAVENWLAPTMEEIKAWFTENGVDAGKLAGGGLLAVLGAKLLDFLTLSKEAKVATVTEGLTGATNPLINMFSELKEVLTGFSIVKFAVAMVALAWALSKLGEIGASGIGVSLGTLGGALVEFITTFAIMSKIIGGKSGTSMIKAGLGMVAMSWALITFAKAIMTYQQIKFESIKDAIKTFGLIFIAVGILSKLAKVTGKNNFKLSNGLGLIAAVVALWAFGKVLNSYTKLKVNRENLIKVLGGLLLAVVVMGSLAKTAGNSNFKFSNGLALIALALSLYLFAGAVKKLGKLDNGTLIKGGLAVAALAFIITTMVKSIAEPLKGLKLTNAIAGLMVMAGVLVLMITVAGLAVILGLIPSNVLAVGALAIIIELGLIILAMKVLVKSLEGFKLGSAIGGLIMMAGMAAMLIVFAGAILVLGMLGTLNPEAYWKGLLAVALIIGGFLAVAQVLKHSKTGKLAVMAIGMLAAAAAMYIAVMAIERLAKVDAAAAVKGVGALGLLLLEFIGMAALTTYAPFLIIGEIVTVGLMKYLADALEPLVQQIERLGATDAEKAERNLVTLKNIVELFFELAGRLASNTGLYNDAISASNLMKTFGETLRPLCDDTAILGDTNPENAAAALEVVKGLVQMVLDLADMLTENTELFDQGMKAADLAERFGTSLRPLCDDTAILGDTNPENAAGSLQTVQGLVDLMLDLADQLLQNDGLFEAGLDASELAREFGEGLEQLCKDVVILGGNASPETSLASVETIGALIDTMIDLATKVKDNAWLMVQGQAAGTLATSFGAGLAQLCTDVVILGGNESAETSLKSVSTIWALIQVMISLANKLKDNQELFGLAERASGVAKSFGAGLEPLCSDVATLGKANLENSQGNLEVLLEVIGVMYGIAEAIKDDNGVYEAGIDAARMVKKFGVALIWLVADAAVLSKVDSTAAIQVDENGNVTGGGFAAVTGIIDYMLALAKKVSEDEGLFEKAEKAAKMCGEFGAGLAWLTAEAFVSQFINPEKSAQVDDNGNVTGGGFVAVAAIIDYMIELSKKFKPGSGLTFGMATSAAESCKAFAGGLAGLLAEAFVSGITNADSAKATFEAIQDMINFLVVLAWKFNRNPALFDKAKEMSDKDGVLRGFAQGLHGLVWDVLLAGFSDADNATASVAAMSDMVDMLIRLATLINSEAGMSEALGTAATTLGTFGKELDSMVANVTGLGYSDINLDNFDTVITKTENLITNLSKLSLGGMNAASTSLDSLARLFEGFAQITTYVSSTNFKKYGWSEAFDNLLGGADNENGSLYRFINSLVDIGDRLGPASEALGGLGTIFEAIASVSSSGLTDADIEATIEKFMAGAKTAITLSIADIEEAMGDIDFTDFNTTLDTFKEETKESMQTFGEDVGEKISTGIGNKKDIVVMAVGLIAKAAIVALRSYDQSFLAAGKYLATGFNNGMMSMANTIANTAGYLGYIAAKAIRNYLNINSPSRVFAEIGEYTVLGFAKGIEDNEYTAVDSINTMGEALVDAMQTATAYANEQSYDLMPSITPVFDMSEMTRQASGANKMINGFNMGGVLAQANVDGATINNSIQNRDVVNEIRILNERMEAMDRNMQNLQIVLDTGTLVGETSAMMDSQLGRMAMRKGRGN